MVLLNGISKYERMKSNPYLTLLKMGKRNLNVTHENYKVTKINHRGKLHDIDTGCDSCLKLKNHKHPRQKLTMELHQTKSFYTEMKTINREMGQLSTVV